MKTLILEARRTGYGPDQIGHTMTVGDLMEYLEGFDKDMPVITSHDNGYTFGPILEFDFRESDDEDEDEDEE